jgi:predicted flavoprotein YhiN
MGDIVITHYGLESGLVYKQGRALRAQQKQLQPLVLTLDLLPDVTVQELAVRLKPTKNSL